MLHTLLRFYASFHPFFVLVVGLLVRESFLVSQRNSTKRYILRRLLSSRISSFHYAGQRTINFIGVGVNT